MDSERRHELQHNALESELSKAWTFIRANSNQIFWTIIIIASIILIVLFFKNKIRTRDIREAREYAVLTSAANPIPRFDWRRVDWRQADWDQLSGCYPFKGMLARAILEQDNIILSDEGVVGSPVNYARIQERAYGGDLPKIEDEISQLVAFAASAHDDRLAGMALVTAGDLRLTQYLLALKPDETTLDAAAQLYQQAATDYADDGLVVGKAEVGLAKVAENRWALDLADEAYTAVLATPGNEGAPAAMIATIGRNRIEDMRDQTPLPTVSRSWGQMDPDAEWTPDLEPDLGLPGMD